ncbi:uncharacterized protein DUF3106 [Trinickia symbiotica]|uniref:DUF3106 domain-containing protein n=1 Tax=Trinickia symbiotica TaxID=863227 RepID=A0A2N7X3E3_9BURK|nr:DUF3106 domain-containing protein [Trinickia symbiotica]PMS35995.1 DUF3106 domain-containing protein [Trinickia symbiotica]PPK45649.1 uncharacterized protein DUF3106 [Trinickia symbiotica]
MSYKRGLAVVFACAIASAVAFAATYHRFFAPPPAAAHAAAGASAPAVASASTPGAPLALDFPPLVTDHNPLSWARLTPAQHAALAPFAAVWDKFSDERKRKWIKIASGFAKMSPERQKRLHEQMAEWVRMTPEQRRVARENYQLSKALPPQARQKAWTAYQQLSPEQKARLAASERKRRPTVVSAPPSGAKSEIRGLNRLVEQRPGAGSSVASATSASAPVAVPPPSVPTAPASPAPANSAPLSPSEDQSGIFKGA